MPSCSRLAPLPVPVRYVVGHRVHVRERCIYVCFMYTERTTYRLFGRLSRPRLFESHLGPWPRWRNLSGRQWSKERLNWRWSLFVLDLQLHNVIVALDTNRGCSHLLYTRPTIYTCVCLWSCAQTCAHIYVRIHTCRIIHNHWKNIYFWNRELQYGMCCNYDIDNIIT